MKEVFKKPLISIIVPIYNVKKYLNECIDSLIKQDYKNIEIILVDDGSTDSSSKICDEYAKNDKRIKVIHKKNEGVSAARNDGIKAANGEWVSFVDADDWVEENYISSMYNIAYDNKTNYVVCGYKRVYNDRVEKINFDEKKIQINSLDYVKKLLNVQNGYGFCHMKLINKKILKQVTFDTNLKVGEDALFNIKICKKIKKVSIINKCLYNYRFNNESVVRKYDKEYISKYSISMEKMKKTIINNYNDNAIIVQSLHNYIAYHALLIAVNYCYHPNNYHKYKNLVEFCKIPLFDESIKKANYEDLSLSRKITLFTLKFKLYFLTGIICKIRQSQFKK